MRADGRSINRARLKENRFDAVRSTQAGETPTAVARDMGPYTNRLCIWLTNDPAPDLRQACVYCLISIADQKNASTPVSIRRHTLYNLLGSVIPLAVALVTIPLYLKLIGEARYGVLAIAWLLLGYFGLFDLGLGRATAQRLAALRDGTPVERAEAFWTALALNVGLGVIGGLAIWPAAYYFFGHVFKVDEALRPEILAAVPWLILAVPMATLSGVLSGALQGRERFLELNMISGLGTALFQLIPLGAALLLGPSLDVLIPATLISRVFTLVMFFERCQRHVIQHHAPTFARQQARALLGFGGWVTVTAFISPIMSTLDRFVIGAIAGAEAVTSYTVPFQLAQRSTILSGALSSALFPRFTAISRQEELRLAHEGLRALLVVMTPMVAGGLVLIQPFLSWWIEPAFATRSAHVGQILLLGFWANSLAYIPFAQLQARGRPDLVAKCHLLELLPYLGLLFVGLTLLGTAGAAVAFSARVIVDFALLAGLAGTLRSSLRSLWPPMALLAAALLIASLTDPGTPLWFALCAGLLILTVAWAWSNAPTSLRSMVASRLTTFAINGFGSREFHE